MSWLAIAMIVIGVWVAIKVAGALLTLVCWGVVLIGIYWFVAPIMHWPRLF